MPDSLPPGTPLWPTPDAPDDDAASTSQPPMDTLESFGFKTEPATAGPSKKVAILGLLTMPVLIGVLLASFLITPTVLATVGLGRATAWLTSQAVNLDYNEPLPQQSTLIDANGEAFATLYAEHRVPVTYAEIPRSVINALVATEDSRFWQHNGVDWIATGRVAIANATHGSIEGGGSGITQQYVKNLLLSQAVTDEQRRAATETTISRKIREAATAMDIEKHLTKEEILTGYLNTVFFGDRAYGLGAAALHFFGKDAVDLTLDESALLVGMIQSPYRYDPIDHPEAAIERRRHVLDRMVTEGYISQSQADTAADKPIKLDLTDTPNGCGVSTYPLYCEWIRRTILDDPVFGKTPEARERTLYKGGLQIRTALEPTAMAAAQKAVSEALPADTDLANAIAVVQPGTGRVIALAMNRKFGTGGKDKTEILLPTTPAFQAGSTFKVITAATALEGGWNPDAVLTAPSVYKDIHNVGNGAGGTLNLAGAVYRSMNTWFVMLEEKAGLRRVADMGIKMGMTSIPLTGSRAVTETTPLTMTLGSYETSVLQVATVYATIAAGGIACHPIGIVELTRVDGKEVPKPEADCTRVMRESTADTLIGILRNNVKFGTGTRAQLPGGRETAGKTGTTDDAGAIWFGGFTRDYAAAVWFGDPRSAQKYPIGNGLTAFGSYWPPFGGGAPAETWKRAMTGIHDGLPLRVLATPGGETYVGVTALVPDVRGIAGATAKAILEEAGYTVKVLSSRKQLDGIASGAVINQQPSAGATSTDHVITITVSR